MRVRDLRNYHEVPYEYLRSLLDGKDFVPVSSNGSVRAEEDGTLRLRLHATDVLTAYADGTVTLRNGGWNTVTTRQRLHAVLPTCVRVFSRAYSCYVETQDELGTWHLVPFTDGMRLQVTADGMSAYVLGEDGTHAHLFGALQTARFTGTAYRACLVPSCNVVSAYEEDADEEDEVSAQ